MGFFNNQIEQWEDNYQRLTEEAEYKRDNKEEIRAANKLKEETEKAKPFNRNFRILVKVNMYLVCLITAILMYLVAFVPPTGKPGYQGISDTGISGWLKKNAPEEDR